jgi:hypothetical protein
MESPQIVDHDRDLGGFAASICRVSTYTIDAIYIFDKRRVNAHVARASSTIIQREKSAVGATEEVCCDPFVHCLEDGDKGDVFGLQVTPLHAGAYDSKDVIVCIVKREQAWPSLHRRGERVGDLEVQKSVLNNSVCRL